MKIVNENEILWAKIKKNAIIPTKENENAGYDIYACFDGDFIDIPINTTKLIPTGLACAMNEKYYLQIEERGSTGSKGIKRSAGVVDSGYRGEIFIGITNCSNKDILISKLDEDKLYQSYKNIVADGEDVPTALYKFIMNKNSVLIYPYTKAICQGIVHMVPNLESKEITYKELCTYDSKRKTSNLGASQK